MVRCHEDDFKIETGQGSLSEYRFNTNVAIHYFCKVCGIYTFHKMRRLPDHLAINVGCIAGIDQSDLRPGLIQGSTAYT